MRHNTPEAVAGVVEWPWEAALRVFEDNIPERIIEQYLLEHHTLVKDVQEAANGADD